VETQSGIESRYLEYTNAKTVAYQIEHIWANKYEQHQDEFSLAESFAKYRNRLGGLLLLPSSFNASFGARTYEVKLEQYNSQNLLARSLHPGCYTHNPQFLNFVQGTGLPFQPHPEFKQKDIEQRGEMYRRIAERIWNPDDLLKDAE